MNHWQLNLAVKNLQLGGVIAYPTESVYGLGCDATCLPAIERLLSIKNRSYKKGLIVLVSEIEQAYPLLSPLGIEQMESLKQQSSKRQTRSHRATTWLIDKHPQLPSLLSGQHDQLAVRITIHPIAKKLCQWLKKPIVSTSCNLNNKPASTNPAIVRNKMKLKVDSIISGQCGNQPPSSIIDLQSGRLVRD